MSTNASIGIKISSNEMKSIYNHWGGYPSHLGELLLKFYNTEEKVKELIEMGNISILGEVIGEKVKFDGFDSRTTNQSLFYARDRGEKGQEPITGLINAKNTMYEWNYLFDDGAWYVRGSKGVFQKL